MCIRDSLSDFGNMRVGCTVICKIIFCNIGSVDGWLSSQKTVSYTHLDVYKRQVNGLRVTDAPTMEIAEMVLNKVNQSLVEMVQELGVKAVVSSCKDGGLLKGKKKYSNGEDIGFVGEITEVTPKILYDLLEKDFLPIVCSIGMDEDYNTYNINADDAACEIAKAVNAEKLAFLTDIEGVYKDPEDPDTLISELTCEEAHALIEEGFIGGGMLPKLNNCIEAIENGVSDVSKRQDRYFSVLIP